MNPRAAACRRSSEEHRPAGPRLIVATLRSGARGKELPSDSSGRTSRPSPLFIHQRGLWKGSSRKFVMVSNAQATERIVRLDDAPGF